MSNAPVPWSFDSGVAAGSVSPAVGAAIPIELPPELQRHGMLWPNPGDQVSDHSAEGAPWLPAARGVPSDPPQGPLPMADHRGDSVPYSAQQAADPVTGMAIAAPATANHEDDGRAWFEEERSPVVGAAPVIGRPFTIRQGSGETRHLVSQAWDALTGRRVNPPDAPSAPHELYGSEHFTRPRMTGYEVGALFDWAWPAGPQFSNDPGYYGVAAYEPDYAQRPRGAVAAQMPDDPYVAGAIAVAAPAPAASIGADFYDLGI